MATLKKVGTGFRPQVRSRHNTHDILRTQLTKLPFRSIVRLGSTTELPDTVTNGGNRVECNTVKAVQNSANKRLMKQCFFESNVKTTEGFYAPTAKEFEQKIKSLKFPIVAKHNFGSRGNGNTLIKTEKELVNWLQGKDLSHYIFEKFYDYSREYRLHITKNGYFYTCRKMLKNETPKDKRWYRNDSNCTWIIESNPSFNKPANWQQIEAECVKALNAVGLDVGACDVKVQSKKGNDFVVIEINSAPSFGEVTGQKYLQIIPQILKSKKA